jgi:hypothetical protein
MFTSVRRACERSLTLSLSARPRHHTDIDTTAAAQYLEMPTRSGRGFLKDGNAQPPRQPAQDARVTRSAKRARSTSDTSPDYPREANRRTRRRNAKNALAGQPQPSEVIDLTRDEDLVEEVASRMIAPTMYLPHARVGELQYRLDPRESLNRCQRLESIMGRIGTH